MKITQEQIKLLIKEELEKILLEGDLIDYEKESCLYKYNACRGSDTENQECTDEYTKCRLQVKNVAAKNALARKTSAASKLQQLKQKRSEEEKRKEEEKERKKKEEKEEKERMEYLRLHKMWEETPEYKKLKAKIDNLKSREYRLQYMDDEDEDEMDYVEVSIMKQEAERKYEQAKKKFFDKHRSSKD